MRTKTLGQIAHEAGELVGSWRRKWADMDSTQQDEWEVIATFVAAVAAVEECERLRGYFQEALADTGVLWPNEMNTLYDKCFAVPCVPDEE